MRDDNDRVNFTLYYETLCPDCRQFVSTEVWRAFQSIASIVNFTFVPYGNAREVYRPETQLYQFYCQHGSDECYGNLIHVMKFVTICIFHSRVFRLDLCYQSLSKYNSSFGKILI